MRGRIGSVSVAEIPLNATLTVEVFGSASPFASGAIDNPESVSYFKLLVLGIDLEITPCT